MKKDAAACQAREQVINRCAMNRYVHATVASDFVCS